MKTLKNTLLILSILFFGLKVNAQKDNSVPCATDELHFEMLKNSSKYQQQFEDNNRNYRDFLTKYQNNDIQRLAGNTVTTLNIVFHDLSQTNTFINIVNDDIGDYQYIVNGLNSIFSGSNLNGLPGNDTMLQFCLARTDSNGDAYTLNELQTANVTQAVLNRDLPAEIQAITLAANTANLFPTTQYMNVYIVDEIIGDTAGFAYLPSAHGIPVDGIYIERELIQLDPDYNTDMTSVAHEIGHYLGLFHIFGICDPNTILEECSCIDDDCTFNGDMVCDTPPTEIPDSQMDYCTVVDPMSCGTTVNDVQRTNFMNYFNNDCRSTFTDGQIERMCFMLDPEFGPRQSILNNLTCVDCVAMDGCEFNIDPNFNNNETTEGTLVSFTATSQNCTENPTPNIEYTWQVINLDTDDTESFTGATISDLALTIGNYTLQLTATLTSNDQCIEQVTYNFQILPAANAICNVETPVNNTDWLNWNRVSYTNGWAVNPNPNITFGNEWDATAPFNINDFQHPTTQRTEHLSADVVPNFDVVNSLINDPNFNTNPAAINIPTGLTNVIRVGDIINTASIPPGAKANYTSITLNPTADQAKFRIHYIGVTAKKENYSINHWDLFDAVDYPTAFGWFLRYRYDSPVDLDVNTPNNKDIGVYENNINFLTDYRFNDFVSRNTTYPNNNINPVTEETIGNYNYDVMNDWRFVDIDLSEFVDHPNLPIDDNLNTEVTITFFSRTNNDAAAINNSYAYFGVECLGGGLPKNITLDMEDLVIPCNVTESCIETEKIVLDYDYDRHGIINNNLYDINTVRIEESLDNVTFTNSSSNYDINSKKFIICLDDAPFRFYRVTLNTLHQTITDTFTVSRGFFYDNSCPGDTNDFVGGDVIGDSNIPLVLCENDIQPIVLELTDPCYLNPAYQWFIMNDNNPIDYDIDGDGIIDGSGNSLNINSNLFLDDTQNQFLEIYRRATVIDPFCGQETTYKSEVFLLYNLNNYKVEIRNWQDSINDLCFGQDLNIDLEVRIIPFLYNNGNPTDLNNHNYDQFLVDNNLNTIQGFIDLTLWIDDVAIETVTIDYNEGLNPTDSNNLNPFQFNTLPIPFLTISNLLPTLNGDYDIRFTATSNFNGCANLDAYLQHPSIPLSVGSAATGGNIDLTVNNCEEISLSSVDDGFSFQDTYIWEYSSTPDFSNSVNIIPVTTANVVNLDISTFNTFPVFFRRTSQAFPVCPNVSLHSNIMTLNAIALTTPTFNLIGPFCSNDDILSQLPTNSTNQPAIVGSWTDIGSGLFTFTPNDNQCAASLTLEIEILNCNECLDCNTILEETLIEQEEEVCGAYTAVVPTGISDCYRVDYYINNVLQGQLQEGASLINFTSNGTYELEIVVVDITVEPENTCAKRSEEITVTCFEECPSCNAILEETLIQREEKVCGAYTAVVPKGISDCYRVDYYINNILQGQLPEGASLVNFTLNGIYELEIVVVDITVKPEVICAKRSEEITVDCFEDCEVEIYTDFSSADVTYADGDQCTAFPFTHFYGPANGPFPWKATIYYAAYHVLLTEDFYDDYNCNVLLNQGTGTNIWMNPHRIKTPPSGHESVMAYWNKSKNTDTNLSGVYTQIDNLEPNTTYQIEFYDLPVRTHAPGRQTANLYYNTKVSFGNQEWNGPNTYYTDDYNYWHLRTMTFTTDATTTSTTLTLQFPLEPDLNNPVNDGYIAIDDIKITCLADGTTKENTSNQAVNTIKNEITIYPNPTTSLFQLKLDNPKDSITEIEVYNIQGLRVMSTPYSKGENINISRLQSGVYFIKATLDSQNQITKKIIKQ